MLCLLSLLQITPHPPLCGPPVSLRLGHRTALALLMQFITVLPLRYPLEKAEESKPSRVILSERMRVEALRSAGGAKPRNEVTKGSSRGYSQPILLLLFATKERDPSTALRFAQDDRSRAFLQQLTLP